MTVFCGLTGEQAALYQKAVETSLAEIESAEGLQRRGMILALLIKLKQICNHPAQYLKINTLEQHSSGKLQRLEEMLEEKKLYGIVTIDKGEAAIGLIKGRKLIVLDEFESWVPRKHHKGGQSARRFERLIDQATQEWLQYVAEKARQYFDKYKDKIQGIIIGGSGFAKHDFTEYLPYYYKDKIIAIVDTGYSDAYGLREALYRAEDKLKELEIEKERKILSDLFKAIALGRKDIALGYEEVKKYLEQGLVQKIIVMEDFPKLDEILELAEKHNVDVEIIEGGTTEAEQFRPIGIAAFLYYASE